MSAQEKYGEGSNSTVYKCAFNSKCADLIGGGVLVEAHLVTTDSSIRSTLFCTIVMTTSFTSASTFSRVPAT